MSSQMPTLAVCLGEGDGLIRCRGMERRDGHVKVLREIGPADESFFFHGAGEDGELAGAVARRLQQAFRRVLAGRDGQTGKRAGNEG